MQCINQIVAARLEGHRVAAWSLTARFSQHGRVLADKGLREELSGAPDTPVDFHTGEENEDVVAAFDDESFELEDTRRLLPGPWHDGFFVARWRRRSV